MLVRSFPGGSSQRPPEEVAARTGPFGSSVLPRGVLHHEKGKIGVNQEVPAAPAVPARRRPGTVGAEHQELGPRLRDRLLHGSGHVVRPPEESPNLEPGTRHRPLQPLQVAR